MFSKYTGKKNNQTAEDLHNYSCKFKLTVGMEEWGVTNVTLTIELHF